MKQIKIVEVKQSFVLQGRQPECSDTPVYTQTYTFPFNRDCDGQEVCIIDSSFLEQNKLFTAGTYLLPNPSLYQIPIRIDIAYECTSKLTNAPIDPEMFN